MQKKKKNTKSRIDIVFLQEKRKTFSCGFFFLSQNTFQFNKRKFNNGIVRL